MMNACVYVCAHSHKCTNNEMGVTPIYPPNDSSSSGTHWNISLQHLRCAHNRVPRPRNGNIPGDTAPHRSTGPHPATRAPPLAQSRPAGWRGCRAVAQHPAHHISVLQDPPIFTHRAPPLAIVVHLHTPTHGRATSHQTHGQNIR